MKLPAWLLSLALLAGCAASPAPGRVVLLTGFEPFGGRPINTSWEAIAPLEGRRVGDATLRCLRLPVEWGRTAAPLKAALDALHPDAVLCLGEGHPGKLSVETLARNQVLPYPDNRKALPGRSCVLPGAPDSYPGALPVEGILSRLRAAGFHAEASSDAGRYLCEECFFTLMHLGRGMKGPRGFLHVPPEMDPARAREAVLLAVQEMLE